MRRFVLLSLHRTNERTKRDFTIYDGDERRTKSEPHKAKVKDGFPESGPTSVSDLG